MLRAVLRNRLLSLAQDCDLLLLGEIHGTREVPYLVASLLEPLKDIGYRILALELPAEALRDALRLARSPDTPLHAVLVNPSRDGRFNMEVLALIDKALQAGWQVICFGMGTMFYTTTPSPTELAELNDSSMAAALLRQ